MRDIYDYYLTSEDYARAAEYGVSQSLLCERIRRLCWDKERAITTPPAAKRTPLTEEQLAVAEMNGLARKNVIDRLYRGWDIERAITTPKCPKIPPRNNTGCSLAALASKHAINVGTLRYRLKAGWAFDEALSRPPMSRQEIAAKTNGKNHPFRLLNILAFNRKVR